MMYLVSKPSGKTFCPPSDFFLLLFKNCRTHLSMNRDGNSSIFKHLSNNKECKEACSTESFKILDNAKTSYELALKEGMHIKWRKPNLNIQKIHEIIKLLI